MADNSNLIAQIIEFVGNLFVNKQIAASVTIPLEKDVPIAEVPSEAPSEVHTVDWTNPAVKISRHFTVKEALWLHQWECMHTPSEEEKKQILNHAQNMDKVGDILGMLIVHCWIRPILNNPASPHHGQDYNALVKGAKNSAHKYGKAVDFNPLVGTCDEGKEILIPKLEELGLRMEDLPPGSNWIHLDCNELAPGGHRLFKP